MYTAQASIRVDASQQRTWDYVSNFGNFDAWMSDIKEVKILPDAESEWHLGGPLGIPVSWKAITTAIEVPRHLAWKSLEGDLQTSGFIKVEPDGTGSRITVNVEYIPPLGAIGEVFAEIFKDPQKMLEQNLEDLSHKLSKLPEDGIRNIQTQLEARVTS